MDFMKLPRFKSQAVEIVCKMPEWAETFKVDVAEIERQMGFAHGWADNNPKKAPKKNMIRYLYNWMLIAERKNSLRKRKVENFKENRADDNEIMTGEDWKRMREAL